MKACFCTTLPIAAIARVGGGGLVGDAVVHEVPRQLVDPAARRLLEQRDRLHQHVGVILLALGQHCLQHRDADRAAEIAHHVEQGRRRSPRFPSSMPAVATADSGAITRAWPMARTMLGQNSWSVP